MQDTFSIAACILAPFYVAWYSLLARRLPGTGNKVILKKLALDQLAGGILGTCVFFVGECTELKFNTNCLV